MIVMLSKLGSVLAAPVFILESGTSMETGTYNGTKIITQTYYCVPV